MFGQVCYKPLEQHVSKTIAFALSPMSYAALSSRMNSKPRTVA